ADLRSISYKRNLTARLLFMRALDFEKELKQIKPQRARSRRELWSDGHFETESGLGRQPIQIISPARRHKYEVTRKAARILFLDCDLKTAREFRSFCYFPPRLSRQGAE